MLEFEKNCTILIKSQGGVAPASVADLQKRLADPKDSVKADALAETILWMIQGETYSKLLMVVIRFAVPSSNHRVKKLLQIFWEIVDKCKADGVTLKEEMILVCNGLLQDLTHSNEYIRGSTLRLLCKIRYIKIVEPLVDAIIKNLSHRHSYVRRNAVMCVFSIVKSFGLDSIPHATEEVEQLLYKESDLSTKRNAFLMLLHCDQEKAIKYVMTVQDSVAGLGDIFQLALLELLRKVCRQNPPQKGAMLRIIVNLVDSCPPAVAYEGASTLVALSTSPVALKAATQAYVNLLCSQADNNVRLIVLDRLADMMKKHYHVLEGFAMDILRALKCPSLEVRKRTLDIALRLVSPRTIQDVVAVLRKEIMKSMEMEQQNSLNAVEYRRLLIRTVHTASSKFPDVAQSVMQLLMDFMTENDSTTTTEVVLFVRELVAAYPSLRPSILQRVAESLPEIQQSRVLRVCFWVLGEYCEGPELTTAAIDAVYEALKPLPISPDESHIEASRRSNATPNQGSDENAPQGTAGATGSSGGDGAGAAAAPAAKVKVTTRTVILEDGTYGTEDVFESVDEGPGPGSANGGIAEVRKTPIRNLIGGGDVLLCSMISVSLTKLILRYADQAQSPVPPSLRAKVTFIVTCLLKFTKENRNSIGGATNNDAAIRITQCLRALLVIMSGDKGAAKKLQVEWFKDVRESLGKVLEIEREAALHERSAFRDVSLDQESEARTEPDELINFRQLRAHRGLAVDALDEYEADLQNAVGTGPGSVGAEDSMIFQQRLAKVQQMTGLADPVYVEAFIQVHQFDLLVELLVMNRTKETLQNVNVELSTHGDLKLVDRPGAVTLSSGQTVTVHGSIKVQSTETGIIFGYVTYDKRSAADKEYLILNELHIDLLDYIQRSWVGELSFRSMWSEFEWENKININTTVTDVGSFLEHIMRNTNMTVVGKYANTPQKLPGPAAGKDISRKNSDAAVDEYLQSVKEMPMLKTLMATSNFFAVNLYSRSIFGEDALANVSIERHPDGKLAGSVRIRSRTQGIALSLGDRITVIQRGVFSPQKR